MNRKISVVGLGHVGLCIAVCFAVRGNKVKSFDIDKKKANLIARGVSPFHEPELETILEKAIQKGNLKVVSGAETAVRGFDICFITVGTPILPSGDLNLAFLRLCIKQIAKALRAKDGYQLVVVKSTVTPGYTKNTIKPLLERYSGKKAGSDFGLVFNPEFLREGSAINDILHPNRIVIGELDEHSGSDLEEFYKEFHRRQVPIVRTNLTTAEMIKYVNNAFLATKISFINEMASICEKLSEKVDIVEVAHAIGMDPRIGSEFLGAGLGWGGSCFPKDISALIRLSKKIGYAPKMLEDVALVNLEQAKHAVDVMKEEIGNLKDKKIAILGLSFKPNTDDVRHASSLRIIQHLIREGARVCAYDPVAVKNAKKVLGKTIEYSSTIANCLDKADGCMLVTEWEEFKNLSPRVFIQLMRNPVLFDGRRIYDPEEFSDKLRFRAIGLRKMS